MHIRTAFTVVVCAACLGSAQTKPAPSTALKADANLAKLMRGIFFPASNVVFAAQSTDPATVKPAKDPSLAPNLLESAYGKWEAVEDSSLALAESANLLLIPGRKCSNGVNAPVNAPDWIRFVQGMRDAGNDAYKAALSKDQDKILAVSDTITTACANCHEKYRDKPNAAERCK